MARGFKSGGRRKGSLNIGSRSLGRKRERVRRDAVAAIADSMPQLRAWLKADATWQSDGAQAARMMDSLMKWVLPAYAKIDPLAENAASAPAAEAQASPSAPSVDDILAAMRRYRPRPSAPPLPQPAAAALPEPAAVAPLSIVPAREAEAMRHAGIPQSDGSRVIPAAPKRAQREAHPDPPARRAPIDAEPEPDDPYWRSRQPAGCVSIHASDAPVCMPEPRESNGAPEFVPVSTERRRYGGR